MSHPQPEHHSPQYINHDGGPRPVYVVRKSVLLSYILWFFLGVFGIHKFYLRAPFMGIFYLILHGLGWLLAPILVGYVFFALLGLLMLIDLFTIPVRVGLINAGETARLNNRRRF
ncbi:MULTISPECIES: TM2 domain-containing protein [Micrococcales]|uniref:TM2 domain-containing protein n=1 Tax=Micrococcales TaxID=85006 RepID=UPI0009E6CDDB|nr:MULTISPECIES: TM2 domain-containing protein [Micrococcales]